MAGAQGGRCPGAAGRPGHSGTEPPPRRPDPAGSRGLRHTIVAPAKGWETPKQTGVTWPRHAKPDWTLLGHPGTRAPTPIQPLWVGHRAAGRGDGLVTQPSLSGDVPSPPSQKHSGYCAATDAFRQVPGAPALLPLLPQGSDAAGMLRPQVQLPRLGRGARRSVLAARLHPCTGTKPSASQRSS